MKKLLFLLFILNVQFTFAQNGQTTKITVFKPSTTSPQAVTKADSLAGMEHNCIKWNYFLLGRGVLMFNYEFLLIKNLTGEIGLGLTYRDFLFEVTKGLTGNGGSSYWENDGTPAIHLCGEGGLRYYFTGFDNFEGAYVGAALSYRPYSFPGSPNIGQYGTLVPGYNFLDAQFKIGYQYESRYSDFCYDVYIGIGYRNATLNYYEYTQSQNYTGYTYIPQTVSESYPQFLFGAKIGYAF
jgi:hypothetical protein